MKIVYRTGDISHEDVMKFLGFSGQYLSVCREAIRNREVLKKASELGITVSDEELQAFSDNYRFIRGLRTADDMIGFLRQTGLTEDDFESLCEASILAEKLKLSMAGDSRIEEHFINYRAEYDLARISVIVVSDESLAKEIFLQAVEEDEDFHKLARKYSLDENTRHGGGYAGMVSRRGLAPEISAKVFSSAPGDILGPFCAGGLFQLILVEDIRRADLDNETRSLIRERIFDEWLGRFFSDGIGIIP